MFLFNRVLARDYFSNISFRSSRNCKQSCSRFFVAFRRFVLAKTFFRVESILPVSEPCLCEWSVSFRGRNQIVMQGFRACETEDRIVLFVIVQPSTAIKPCWVECSFDSLLSKSSKWELDVFWLVWLWQKPDVNLLLLNLRLDSLFTFAMARWYYKNFCIVGKTNSHCFLENSLYNRCFEWFCMPGTIRYIPSYFSVTHIASNNIWLVKILSSNSLLWEGYRVNHSPPLYLSFMRKLFLQRNLQKILSYV